MCFFTSQLLQVSAEQWSNPSWNFKFVLILFAVETGFKELICLSHVPVLFQGSIGEHADDAVCVTRSPHRQRGWCPLRAQAGSSGGHQEDLACPVLPPGRGHGGATRTHKAISPKYTTSAQCYSPGKNIQECSREKVADSFIPPSFI